MGHKSEIAQVILKTPCKPKLRYKAGDMSACLLVYVCNGSGCINNNIFFYIYNLYKARDSNSTSHIQPDIKIYPKAYRKNQRKKIKSRNAIIFILLSTLSVKKVRKLSQSIISNLEKNKIFLM